MSEADSVQTLSIKGLTLPDDQRSAYSIEAPVTPPPSYMKVTSNGKLKIVKILAATLLLLTLLVGSFVLGGVYISTQARTCDCPCAVENALAAPASDSVIPGARLAFLKGEAPAKPEPVVEEEKKQKKKKKKSNDDKKKGKKNKKQNKEREEAETNELPFNLFRRLNLPRLMRTLEKATDDMAERIMEQTRRNRVACLMERRPFMRRNPFMEPDSGPQRRLILAPGGNGLLDCDEILGQSEVGPPPPFSRALRARTVTLPIMAFVSRSNGRARGAPNHQDDMDQGPFPPPPSPFDQPPPPPPEVFPRRLFPQEPSAESERGPMDMDDDETVPNFQVSSGRIMYRHPMHPDGPDNQVLHPILSRFPRK